jgi:hypothetical protein
MMAAGVPTTIKPDDLVRTPSGRTCICEGINADGSRALRDVLNGDTFDMRPKLLTLLRSAPARRWPSYRLA